MTEVCHGAKGIHDQLLNLLPIKENEKDKVWLKAKLVSVNGCIDKEWL